MTVEERANKILERVAAALGEMQLNLIIRSVDLEQKQAELDAKSDAHD